MTDKQIIIGVNKCPFLDEWNHCTLCKEFAKIQDRHLLIEADLRCEEQPSELCYYKQLQQAKNQIADLSKMVESKEQECEQLKTWFVDEQIDNDKLQQFYQDEHCDNLKLKKTLTEIKEIVEECYYKCNSMNNCNISCKYYNNCNGEFSYLLAYLNKQISEVLNDK